MLQDWLLLPALFGLVALLYSSVGHAGASGYLAAMALVGVAPEQMKPTALSLNVLVAAIATYKFTRAGCFSWRVLWPFAAGSLPAAFVGGLTELPAGVFRPLVGCVLLYAAWRMAKTAGAVQAAVTGPPRALACVPVGAAIGLISGLIGVGGGIFLSPLLVFMRWAEIRQTAGISAAFILVNSVAGLVGHAWNHPAMTPVTGVWVATAAIGGLVGAELGSRRFAPPTMRRLLGVVLVIAGFKMILG